MFIFSEASLFLHLKSHSGRAFAKTAEKYREERIEAERKERAKKDEELMKEMRKLGLFPPEPAPEKPPEMKPGKLPEPKPDGGSKPKESAPLIPKPASRNPGDMPIIVPAMPPVIPGGSGGVKIG